MAILNDLKVFVALLIFLVCIMVLESFSPYPRVWETVKFFGAMLTMMVFSHWLGVSEGKAIGFWEGYKEAFKGV